MKFNGLHMRDRRRLFSGTSTSSLASSSTSADIFPLTRKLLPVSIIKQLLNTLLLSSKWK